MQIPNRKKLIYIFLIIYTVSIGLILIFSTILDIGDDKKIIRQFSGESSELYNIKDRQLINTIRENYIFPNDVLKYRFGIDNPLEHAALVSYTFEIFQNAELKHQDRGEWHITEMSTQYKQFEFSLANEGIHNFKMSLQFHNSTDNMAYAQYIPSIEQIQILNLSNKLQDDANRLTHHSLIVASGVGIVTLMGLLTSAYYSKKEVDKLSEQNKNFKEQFSIKNRPWIIIKKVNPKFASYDNHSIPWDEYLKNLSKNPEINDPKEISVSISCTNVGNSPANITEYRYSGRKSITRKELKNMKPQERILFPNQDISFMIKIPYDKDSNFFIAYLIEYVFDVFGKKDSDVVGVQWRYLNRNIFDMDHWSQ